MRLGFSLALLALGGCLAGHGAVLTVGTTTTTQDSGLLDVLLPAFARDSGLAARAVVGGTGEIIEKGKHGDVDVLLTHSPTRERALVAEDWALSRKPVMFNRFLIVGPNTDPAQVRNASSATDAFLRIHDSRATFCSRGDESGTHEKEVALWKSASLDTAGFEHEWYKETGTGQGATLTTAAELDAYMLVDEATLLQFHARGKALNLLTLVGDDPLLRNQYGVTQLNASRIPAQIDADGAATFARWLTGPEGQAAIAAFTIDGTPVFLPNADDPDA